MAELFATAVLLTLAFSLGANVALLGLLRAARREHAWILDHDSHGVTVVVRPDATLADFGRARRELDAHTEAAAKRAGGAR